MKKVFLENEGNAYFERNKNHNTNNDIIIDNLNIKIFLIIQFLKLVVPMDGDLINYTMKITQIIILGLILP